MSSSDFDPVRESGLLISRGLLSAALEVACAAIGSGFREPTLYLNLSVARKRLGDLPGALSAAQDALALAPESSEAHYNLGGILSALGEFEAAISAYENALTFRSDWPEACSALGALLVKQDRVEESLVFHERAHSLKASWYVSFNLGVALQRLGLDIRALNCYREAIRFSPNDWRSHVSLALLLLKSGDFENGWKEYEWRFRSGGLPTPRLGRPQPLWDGRRCDGKRILLYSEQGHGDMIQFFRFAPMVRQFGASVFVECPSNLVRIFSGSPGVDGFVVCDAPCDYVDLQFPLLSLPRILGIKLGAIPAEVPYLQIPRVDVADVDSNLAAYEGLFRVGIVWKGDKANLSDSWRSCTPRDFAVLADVPGVKLFSLQYGGDNVTASDLMFLRIESLSSFLGDFAKTAVVASRLDLIITVDTSMAHLAGALGLHVWNILSKAADWRWMSGYTHSPWYPTMRLFRQSKRGDWGSAFKQVRDALEVLVNCGW